MIMDFNFVGKRILVTGATKGIGRELIKALVEAGAEVYALGRDEEELLCIEREHGSNVHSLKADLAEWDTARSLVEQLPAMDGLVNNAATLGDMSKSAMEAEKHDMSKVFNVNIFGALNMSQVIARKMIAEGKQGSIVNVSSIAGISAMKIGLGYALSKAALDMLTKRLALELGPHNIRVNSVSPSWIKTPGVLVELEQNPEKKMKILDHMPLRRIADISEAVSPILYMLSTGSSMVTGTTHLVDGGCTSHLPI